MSKTLRKYRGIEYIPKSRKPNEPDFVRTNTIKGRANNVKLERLQSKQICKNYLVFKDTEEKI